MQEKNTTRQEHFHEIKNLEIFSINFLPPGNRNS